MARLTQPSNPYPRSPYRATGYSTENVPRMGATMTSTSGQTTAKATGVGFWFRAGEVVTNLTIVSGATPAAAVNNIWFALAKADMTQVAITADDGANGWTANTVKTLALTPAYTIPADGLYYVVIMVNAGTVPTLYGVNAASTLNGLAPSLGWRDDVHTPLTNPASAPATYTASVAVGTQVWIGVS